MSSETVLSIGSIVETSEWFDWLREQLVLGGVSLPSEETAVLFIEQARHLASRVRAIYGLVPDSLERRIIEAALIYQCWDSQRQLTVHAGTRRPRRILPAVVATSYIGRIGLSGRHHLMEANDGFKYVVTIPSGLWTEKLPATEVICSELARLLGLTVPNISIVSVGPDLLRMANAEGPNWMQRSSKRRNSELCSGVRYINADGLGEDSLKCPIGRGVAKQITGALVFDAWVLNLARTKYISARDPASGLSKLIFFDYSHCLAGADWTTFWTLDRKSHAATPNIPRLFSPNSKHVGTWIQKAIDMDLNGLWELAFEIPPKWYGGNRSALASMIGTLQARTFSITNSFYTSIESVERPAGNKPVASVETPSDELDKRSCG
jgi:hypothetical protein